METIRQITIHPREIPPRRKLNSKPKSVFRRPFDPPPRVGTFPAPDPPPFQTTLRIKTQEKAQETTLLSKHRKKLAKAAIEAYEADDSKFLAKFKSKKLSAKENAKANSVKSIKNSPKYLIKKYQESFYQSPSSQINLLA